MKSGTDPTGVTLNLLNFIELNMSGLQDFTTILPGLLEEAKRGNTKKIEDFLNSFICFQIRELKLDGVTLSWVRPTDSDPRQTSRRFQITSKGTIVAYGAVSATETLVQLKEQEFERLKKEVLDHTNRKLAYFIVSVKQNGLLTEFAEVRDGRLMCLLENDSTVSLGAADGSDVPNETHFRGLLNHCIHFAS